MAHDPMPQSRISGYAWARFRRLLRWTTVTAFASVAAAFLYLILVGSELRIHMMIATAIGVFLTVMLGGTLMALAFLSSGTGHDDDVAEWSDRR